MSLGPARQIPSLSAILVVTPPVLLSVILFVCTGGSLKGTRSGDSTGKEFAKFTRPLESNFANSIPVESPELVPFRDPPVQTNNITDGGTGGVTTRIADKDGIWRARPSDIIMAATHASHKDFDAKLAYCKYLNDLDLETIQMLERDKRARENMENNLTRTDRQNLGELEHLGEHENIPTRI